MGKLRRFPGNAELDHEVRLLATIKDESGTFPGDAPHLRCDVRPVYFTEEGHIRNISAHWRLTGLEDLVIAAAGTAGDTDYHSWHLAYVDIFSADLAALEARARALKAIQRRLDTFTNKFGNPETFGAYLARVSVALGATHCGRQTRNQGWSYDDGEYTWMDPSQTTYWLTRQLAEFCEANPSPAS